MFFDVEMSLDHLLKLQVCLCGTLKRWCGNLKRWCGTLKRAVWYSAEGIVVLYVCLCSRLMKITIL